MNIRLLFFNLLLGLETLSVNASQQAVFTIEQAVDYALKNAFSVRIAQTNIDIAHEQVVQAKGALGPQISAQGVYTRFSQSSSAKLPIGPGGALENIKFTHIQDEKIIASLNLPIDILGVLSKSIQSASYSQKAAVMNFDATHNNLKAQVRAAYYNVLQSKELVEVAKESLHDAEVLLKNTESKLNAGTVPKYNLTQFEVQVQQAKAALYNAEAAYNLSKQTLNNTIGRSITTPFEPVPVKEIPHLMSSNKHYAKYALEYRPEIRAARYVIDSAAENKIYQAYGMTPSLGLSGVYTRDFHPSGFGGFPSLFIATATLNIPVYDSGITNSRIKIAKEQMNQAKIQYDQTSLAVQLQVDQALVNLKNAFLQIEVAQKSRTYSESSYHVAKASYDAGVNVLLDLLDSYTQLVQSRATLVNARYSYLNAYAALQQAVGDDQLEQISQKEDQKNNP